MLCAQKVEGVNISSRGTERVKIKKKMKKYFCIEMKLKLTAIKKV